MAAVEPVVRIFDSFADADAADREFYRGLTPAARLDILLALVARRRGEDTVVLGKYLKDFLLLLNSHAVEYVIVGGYAFGYYGRPRYTGDVDFLVRPTEENGAKLERVIAELGVRSLGLRAKDFITPDRCVQLGQDPDRIDLLTSISGVDFDEAWAGRVSGELDCVPVNFLGRSELIKNKRATGRTRDLADLEELGAS